MKAGKPEIHKTNNAGAWCWLVLLLIIICSAVIRVRLASLPLERDEGEYAYIGQQMLRGVPPFESAYSMKLLGIDAVYAIILAVFGQTQTAIHAGLIVFNAAAILVIFLLAKDLFGRLAGITAAGAYAIMSMSASVLGLSANAEHFLILPALVGIWLIAKPVERLRAPVILAAGLLFGLAFVIKQHGIFFGIFGALYLLYLDIRRRPISWKSAVITQLVFAAGAVFPFALTCFLFLEAGLFDKFWFWTFTYAGKYATSVPLPVAWAEFKRQSFRVLKSSELIWGLAAVGIISVFLIRQYRRRAVLLVGLLIFSFFAVCPGLYFREHYFIFILPAGAILAGAGFVSLYKLFTGLRIFRRAILMSVIGLGIAGYSLYEQRAYLFENSPVGVSRLVYGLNPFPESLRIAEYIREHTGPDDRIAVIGSEPQIYFYSRRRSATRFIYMYPLMELHDYAAEMQKEMIAEIEQAKPKYMVFVRVSASWLTRPDSVKLIFEWFNSYCPEYYSVVGIADIISCGQTVWKWDEQAADYKPTSKYWVAVLRRKQ